MNPQKNWRDFGACRDEDPDLHYPNGETGPALLQAEEAKAVCRRCPIADTCLEDAMAAEGTLNVNARYGIRGGLTPRERFALYKRRYKQAVKDRQAVNA